VPLEGEIIVISDAFRVGDKSYPGIKIGDDKQTPLANLEYLHGEKEIVSVTRNAEDTGYTVLLSNNESYTLYDGQDGEPGTPGTSVTITNVNQNTSSGGVSTVTFSDGKTLSIYNGKDGASGEGGGSVDLTNIDVIGQGGSTLISENVAAFGQLNTVGQKCFNIIIPEGSNAYDSEDEKTYAILP